MLGQQKNPGSSNSAPTSTLLESPDESAAQEDHLELRPQSGSSPVWLQKEIFQAVEAPVSRICFNRASLIFNFLSQCDRHPAFPYVQRQSNHSGCAVGIRKKESTK